MLKKIIYYICKYCKKYLLTCDIFKKQFTLTKE